MEAEKEYVNKDLYNIGYEKFCKDINNDFIGDDIVDQLEWALMITQGKFKQIRHSEAIKEVNVNSFDKSFLISSSFNREDMQVLSFFGDFQVNPEIFPHINIKFLNIGDSIQFNRVRELNAEAKRGLLHSRKYVYELDFSYYKKDTESFYSSANGYEVNPLFFNFWKDTSKYKTLPKEYIPYPIPLKKGYVYPGNALSYLDNDIILMAIKQISMAYQIALSLYYEWTIYIKEYDNIGIIIPIDPSVLSDMYKTSLLNFDNKKAMIHFVRDYYRRKKALPNEDYSVYVNKYIRGENKFEFRSFKAEIIPPKYDLNRVKTRKNFINPFN